LLRLRDAEALAAMNDEQHTPREVLGLFPAHDQTLCGMLDSRASVDDTRPFLIFQDRSCAYGQAVAQVSALGAAFADRGLSKGDRVAIMATNSDRYVLVLFALARIGAIAVPINPELKTAEAACIFHHAEVTSVACTPETLAIARGAAAEMAVAPWFLLL